MGWGGVSLGEDMIGYDVMGYVRICHDRRCMCIFMVVRYVVSSPNARGESACCCFRLAAEAACATAFASAVAFSCIAAMSSPSR